MGVLQARILEWVAMPSSRGSSLPRDPACISYVSCIGRPALYHWCHLGNPLLSLAGGWRLWHGPFQGASLDISYAVHGVYIIKLLCFFFFSPVKLLLWGGSFSQEPRKAEGKLFFFPTKARFVINPCFATTTNSDMAQITTS